MAFGAISGALSPDIINAIRSRQARSRTMPTDGVDDIQDQPPSEIQNYRPPFDERLPDGSSPINPGVRPMGGVFARGNDIQRPEGSLDVSNVEYEPPAPIQTPNGVGVFQRPEASIAQPLGKAPSGEIATDLHQHSLDETDTHIKRPNAQRYAEGFDANDKHIGRLSRFGHGFMQNAQGGLLPGVFGGLLGLLAPSVGNRAVFNSDNARFKSEQSQEMGLERQNTGYQNQLETQQKEQQLPLEMRKFGDQQKVLNQNRMDLDAQRAAEKRTQLKQTADAAMERLNKQFENTTFLKGLDAKNKANARARELISTYTGNQAFDALSPAQQAEFISGKLIEERQQKIDESVSREAENIEQAATAKDRREHPDKYRTPASPKEITPTYRMQLRLRPIEIKQRKVDAAISAWERSLAKGDITQTQFEEKTKGLKLQKDAIDAEWATAAALEDHNADPTASNASDKVAPHPKQGKEFKGADGKMYIADEIKGDDIIRYHLKP